MNAITTAARRIARTSGEYSAGWRLYFDGAGRKVDAIHDPEGRRESPSGYAVAARGGRITQRQAQDELDAFAALEPLMGAGEAHLEVEGLVQSWHRDDEAGRPRRGGPRRGG